MVEVAVSKSYALGSVLASCLEILLIAWAYTLVVVSRSGSEIANALDWQPCRLSLSRRPFFSQVVLLLFTFYQRLTKGY